MEATTYRQLQKINEEQFDKLSNVDREIIKKRGYYNIGDVNLCRSYVRLLEMLEPEKWCRLNELVGRYKRTPLGDASHISIRKEIFDIIDLDLRTKYNLSDRSLKYAIFYVLKEGEHIEYTAMCDGRILQAETLELGNDIRNARTFGTYDSCARFLNYNNIRGLIIVPLVQCKTKGWEVYTCSTQ